MKGTREKILDAALELFSERGYRGTTTKSIANRAGVNEITIFRHFDSKENLFYKTIEREAESKKELLESDLEPSENLIEDLAEIGSKVYKNLMNRADFFKIVMMEVDRDQRVFDHFSEAPRGLIEKLSSYFEKAREKGLVRDIDPRIASVSFFSFFLRSMLSRAFIGEDIALDFDDSAIRKYVEIFVDGISGEVDQ